MTSRAELKTVAIELLALLFAGEAIWAHYVLLASPTLTVGFFVTTPMAIVALCGNVSLTGLAQILGARADKQAGYATTRADTVAIALAWLLTVQDFALAGSKRYNIDGVGFTIATAVAFFILSEVNAAAKKKKGAEESPDDQELSWEEFDLELELLTRGPLSTHP